MNFNVFLYVFVLRTMAQCKIPLKDCLTNPQVEIKQPLMDAGNKKLDNSFLFLTINYTGAKKKAAAAAGGPAGGAEGQAAEGPYF